VSVTFTAPAGPVESYTVTASPDGASATGTASLIVVGGLTNGSSYTFTVHATNASGDGPESAASNAVTPAGPPGAPTAPSAVPGDGQATVSFAAPSSTGGAPVSYYTATASPGGQSANSTGSPIIVFGLTNGVSHTFTVSATSDGGTGPPSAPSSPVTPTGGERPHPDPPAEVSRPPVPAIPEQGPRVPPPAP